MKDVPRLIGCGLVLVVLCGCGEKGPELGEVSGTITLEGEPVEGAVVTFLPLFEGGVEVECRPKTDADGNYSMRYSVDRPGVLLGEHRVMISTEDSAKDPVTGAISHVPERIPKHYTRDSILTYSVEPGKNDASFDLKKKKPK